MESPDKIVVFPSNGSVGELTESTSERFAIKIYSYRKWIGLGIGALFGVASVLVLVTPSQSKKLHDYVKAEKTFDAWVKTNEINQKILADLQQLMKKHPELASKMEGDIYQRFVSCSRVKEVIQAANRQINKTVVLGDYFTKFSAISLLIGSQEYQEALEQSRLLHKKMMDDFTFHKTSSGELLIPFNLFRIGVLEKKLSLINDELDSWKALRAMLLVDGQIKPSYQPFVAHFNQNGVSLLDYIQTRETTLSTQ
ncbi:MAG: hypothetical protein HY860_01945 [Chlamydiales bacterium]|nr:hypothetical protein [Chlamydiales bacterium]